MTKPITPTIVICAAAALTAGIALARPGDPPSASSAPPATVYPSDSGASDDRDDTEAAVPAAIEIVDFDYAGDLSVAVAQPIVVTNADGAPHTLTAVDGDFDTSVIEGGATGQVTAPTAAGTYDFFCAVHPSMTATLTVTP